MLRELQVNVIGHFGVPCHHFVGICHTQQHVTNTPAVYCALQSLYVGRPFPKMYHIAAFRDAVFNSCDQTFLFRMKSTLSPVDI